MINFIITKKTLEEVLNIAKTISPAKHNVNVFTYTKIVLNANTLSLTVFNQDSVFTKTLELSSLDNFSNTEFLIHTSSLAESIKLITDEQVAIEIDLDKTILIVKGSKSKHKIRINLEELKDFNAEIPNQEEIKAIVKTNRQELNQAIKNTFASVGTPQSVYDPQFLHVCFTLDIQNNSLKLVSTDRYRINKNVLSAEYSNVNEPEENYLLLPKLLQYYLSLNLNQEIIELYFYKDKLCIEFEGAKLALKYGIAKYPDYEKIIPQSFACSFEIDKSELVTALKQVYLIAKNNIANKSVTLNVEPGKSQIILTSSNDKGEEAEALVSFENYEGSTDNWSQSYNADYIIDYLNSTTAEKIVWEANPGKPSVLSPKDQKNKEIYLVSGLK
jgi:DNA polymerase-3 subunit beta